MIRTNERMNEMSAIRFFECAAAAATQPIHNWNIFELKINFSASARLQSKKGFNEHISFVAILINFSGHVPCAYKWIPFHFISCVACASAISERHMQFNEKSSIPCMWIYMPLFDVCDLRFNSIDIFVCLLLFECLWIFRNNFWLFFDDIFVVWILITMCAAFFVNFTQCRSQHISVERKRTLTLCLWIFMFCEQLFSYVNMNGMCSKIRVNVIFLFFFLWRLISPVKTGRTVIVIHNANNTYLWMQIFS